MSQDGYEIYYAAVPEQKGWEVEYEEMVEDTAKEAQDLADRFRSLSLAGD